MSLPGKFRELKTGSLLLRALDIEHSSAMFDIYSDAETMKYWAFEPVKNLAAAREMVKRDIEWVERGEAITWSVILASTSEVIGKCILFQFSEANRRAEVGYILNRRYWRKGLMAEAMTAVVNFAFNDLKLHRLEADSDPENQGSLRLLEKLGFRREGLFRDRWYVYGEWQDSVMLGLLSSDWKVN